MGGCSEGPMQWLVLFHTAGVLVHPDSAKGHISNISHLVFLEGFSLSQKVVGKIVNFRQALQLGLWAHMKSGCNSFR